MSEVVELSSVDLSDTKNQLFLSENEVSGVVRLSADVSRPKAYITRGLSRLVSYNECKPSVSRLRGLHLIVTNLGQHSGRFVGS
jgi:hypothetical protein